MNTLVIMTQSQPFAKDLIRDNEIYNDIFSRASNRTQEASSSTPAYILGPAFAGPISEKIIPHFP